MDFGEVLALVAQMETMQLLIAMLVHGGWEVHHMDAKSMFLNDELAKELYVHQPPVFIDDKHKL